MSDIQTEAEHAPAKEVDSLTPPPAGGLGIRLGILVLLFAIAAGGIMGYRYYLESQMPPADPDHIKKQRDPSEIPESDGATLEAPDAA